jgi:hypothetical protein
MIRRKSDVHLFIENFEEYSNKDGDKYYLTFNTENPIGTVTIMKYQDGTFTYHRKNEVFWDVREIGVEGQNLTKVIWDNRKFVNKCLKVLVV